MLCQNCGEADTKLVNSKNDGQGYYEEETYECPICRYSYIWKMTKEILNEGKKQDE